VLKGQKSTVGGSITRIAQPLLEPCEIWVAGGVP
jgi:hypothetical protein